MKSDSGKANKQESYYSKHQALQSNLHKASSTPSTKSHRARSETIVLGITVSQRLSDKSIIRYPPQKKSSQPQILPKLFQKQDAKMSGVVTSSKESESKLGCTSMNQLDNTYLALPKIFNRAVDTSKADLSDSDSEDAEWTTLQQRSLASAALDACKEKEILAVKVGQESQVVHVAKEVLFQSSTLEHIYHASKHFLEGEHGLCLSSVPSFYHFSFILEFLNRKYLKKQTADLSMYRKFYIPTKCLVGILEYALYLDLDPLVDQCASMIARKCAVIDYNLLSETLPSSLIRLVLKQLSVGDLILVEHFYSVKSIDITTIWCEKYFKLPSRQDEDMKSSIQTYKQNCLQFYVSQALQNIMKGGNSIDTEKLLQILEFEGGLIKELQIKLIGQSARKLPLDFWIQLFEYCPNCFNLSIICDQYDPAISNLLSSSHFLRHNILKISIDFLELGNDRENGLSLLSRQIPSVFQYCKYPTSLATTSLQQAEVKRFEHLQMSYGAKFNLSSTSKSTAQNHTEVRKVTQKSIPISVRFLSAPNDSAKSRKKNLSDLHLQQPASLIFQSNALIFPYVLELSFSQIFMPDLTPFSQLLDSNVYSSIKTLKLKNVVIEMVNLLQLLRSLAQSKSIQEQLECLEFSGIIKGTDDQVLESSKLFGLLISSCAKLNQLDLSGNMISTAGMRQICDALPSSKIQELNMSHLNILTVLPMISKWTCVTKNAKVTFQNCGLVPRMLCTFIPSLSRSMKSLDISFNTIDQKFIECFKEWVSSSLLESLSLNGCKGISDFSFLVAAKHLKRVEMNRAEVQDSLIDNLAGYWSRNQLMGISRWAFRENNLSDNTIDILKDAMIRLKRPTRNVAQIEIDLSMNTRISVTPLMAARFVRQGEVLFLKL